MLFYGKKSDIIKRFLQVIFSGISQILAHKLKIKAKELNNYRFLIDSAEPLSKPTGLSKSSSFKDLLSLEGTSKYAEINLGINATLGRKMKENLLKQNKKIIKQTEPVGTIPFLGMFLRDLEYLNAQSKRMDKNMINVQQKRKEFEIIAQIKLLQQASHLYSIKPDPSFDKWLHSHKLLDRNDFSNYSNQIESGNESARNSRVKSNISYRSESNESLNQMSFTGLKTPGVKQKSIFKTKSNHSRCSSIGSSDLADSSESPKSILKNSMSNSSQNDSCNTSNSIECSPISNQYTVKVKIEQNEPAKRPEAEILYKKMCISNQDRTKEVKTRILSKFFMNPELYDEFVLVQVLDVPNEIPIGDNSNVFYALRNSEDMQLVLRKRTLSSTPSSNNSSNSYASHNRISSLPPQCPNKSTYKNNSPTIRKFLRKIFYGHKHRKYSFYFSTRASFIHFYSTQKRLRQFVSDLRFGPALFYYMILDNVKNVISDQKASNYERPKYNKFIILLSNKRNK
ncbi:ral guanine nucleotide dissociation stimulator-like 1 isoform X2 [Brachionus plicatilis]|uniref:Ral guanine nucleotide dissociation stimulator-like 1 isoform X2 n=1 Tax=Brachionus plicatilis TaxID=10195 RepID=A0A3M7SQ50_BRAPC|nr:ral guanine nucleotide dissociation stimulator-like 1 isoform X2 [Brachionus plicatilis]